MSESGEGISVVLREPLEGSAGAWYLECRQEPLKQKVLCDGLQVDEALSDACKLLKLVLFLKELIGILVLDYLVNFVHSLIDQRTKSLELFQVTRYVPKLLGQDKCSNNLTLEILDERFHSLVGAEALVDRCVDSLFEGSPSGLGLAGELARISVLEVLVHSLFEAPLTIESVGGVGGTSFFEADVGHLLLLARAVWGCR